MRYKLIYFRLALRTDYAGSQMESSVRLLVSTAALHRQLRAITVPSLPFPLNTHSPRFIIRGGGSSVATIVSFSPTRRLAAAGSFFSHSPLSSHPITSIISLSLTHIFASDVTNNRAFVSDSDTKGSFFDRDWETLEKGDSEFCAQKGTGKSWTVVLLGWLGAETKHLNKYAGLYSSNGIRPVKFVIPVKELLGLDLGRKVQDKIARFTRELVSWCSQTEKDGKERCLLFHTFSNTGWLTYGNILENLQTRPDILQKIKGCVIDSGAAPEISPQIWAAGFCAALLKRRSSLISSSVEEFEGARLDVGRNGMGAKEGYSFRENFVFSLLEKFFAIILKLPDVSQRLEKIISVLTNRQPLCPQLYLYSSADKVIPANSVENSIDKQKKLGRTVYAHNFGSSPHVDHLRSYPQIYSTKINEFLKECCFAPVS